MDKIDEGLQYRVFEAGEETVLKVPKDRDEMVETIHDWDSWKDRIHRWLSRRLLELVYLDRLIPEKENAETPVQKGLERREKAVENLRDEDFPLEDLFGIKSFEGSKVYQKRMVAVEDFEAKNFEEIVDDYIDLLHRLWIHGIGDTIYNFTINNGYRDGKMYQLDFGEIVFDRDRVREEVENEKWLEKWSHTEHLDEEEKKIFREKMRERVTVEKLEDKWNSNLEK